MGIVPTTIPARCSDRHRPGPSRFRRPESSLPFAGGLCPETPTGRSSDLVDAAAARSRLEAMVEDLDRSIAILRGESPERDHSAADAGSGLSDRDRVEAALDS